MKIEFLNLVEENQLGTDPIRVRVHGLTGRLEGSE
jgi:hypothetical protein